MIKLRYASSFVISSVLYTALGFSFVSLLDAKKLIEKEVEKPIKISVITPVPKVIAPPVVAVVVPPVVVPPKKIEKEKPKKIIKKKPVKKEIIKKPKKIVKKIEKKVVKKPKPKPKPIVEEVYEEVYEEIPVQEMLIEETPYVPAPIVKTVVTQSVPVATISPIVPIAPIKTVPTVNLDAKKRVFLNEVRATIHANKKYPKMAERRKIVGTVHAVFDIKSDGTVSNIQTSGGASILQKAVRKSIERSFPTNVPHDLKSKFPMYGISVNIEFVTQ